VCGLGPGSLSSGLAADTHKGTANNEGVSQGYRGQIFGLMRSGFKARTGPANATTVRKFTVNYGREPLHKERIACRRSRSCTSPRYPTGTASPRIHRSVASIRTSSYPCFLFPFLLLFSLLFFVLFFSASSFFLLLSRFLSFLRKLNLAMDYFDPYTAAVVLHPYIDP